jgi:hypothetical protein
VDLDEIDFEPERGGIITLASSPPKRTGGMFYDLTRPGSDKHRPYSERAKTPDWDGYSSHAWNLKDVVTLPDAERRYPALVALRAAQLREFARKGWDEDHPIRKREYDGIWSEDNTTHVFRFREDVNTWDPFAGRPLEGMEALKIAIAALPKDVWHFILAIDSGGTRDPFAINLFAFAPADAQRRMFHVFGIEKMGLYARTIAEILIGPEPEKHPGIAAGGILSVAGWPDAIELDGDEPTIQELKNVYGIQCRKSDRRADYKFGAVELVNGDLGAEKIFVLKKSPLAVQMRDLQWKADEYGILRENKAQANHSTDTLLYARRALSMLFESGAVATEEAQPAYVDPMGLGGGEERDPYSDMLTEAEWSEA